MRDVDDMSGEPGGVLPTFVALLLLAELDVSVIKAARSASSDDADDVTADAGDDGPASGGSSDGDVGGAWAGEYGDRRAAG